MTLKVTRMAVLLAALAGGLVVGTPAAGAAAASAPPPQPVAGYLVSETGLGQASARFTVPTVTCSGSASFSGSFVGAELLGATPLIAAYEIGCSGTTPVYAGVIAMNGELMTIPGVVKPGDVVTVWVKEAVFPKDNKAFVQANIANLTEGGGAGAGGNAAPTVTEAAVGVIALHCATDGCAPVAPFTSVSFASAKLNGTSLAGSTRSALKALDGTVEAKAATFDTTTKSRFVASWVSTCATPDPSGRC